jgi:hypothetical protein
VSGGEICGVEPSGSATCVQFGFENDSPLVILLVIVECQRCELKKKLNLFSLNFLNISPPPDAVAMTLKVPL